MMPEGPNLFITFLYYFSSTILIVLLLTSQGMEIPLNTGIPYQMGVLLGLIAGTLGAYFNRSVTISGTFKNPKAFQQSLNQALSQMGLLEQEKLDDVTIYGKSNFKTLFSGKILVKIAGNSVQISGRSSNLKRLKKILETVQSNKASYCNFS